jgi:hypothetical protein
VTAALDEVDLARIATAVRAVVDRDEAALSQFWQGRPDELFRWTEDYGLWGKVDLMYPPGQPVSWDLDVTTVADGDVFIVVPMWTLQEGRSDLSLELRLHRDGTQIEGLHVL